MINNRRVDLSKPALDNYIFIKNLEFSNKLYILQKRYSETYYNKVDNETYIRELFIKHSVTNVLTEEEYKSMKIAMNNVQVYDKILEMLLSEIDKTSIEAREFEGKCNEFKKLSKD